MAAVEAMSNPKGQDLKVVKSDDTESKVAAADTKVSADLSDSK
jgi:hypothetical protein